MSNANDDSAIAAMAGMPETVYLPTQKAPVPWYRHFTASAAPFPNDIEYIRADKARHDANNEIHALKLRIETLEEEIKELRQP